MLEKVELGEQQLRASGKIVEGPEDIPHGSYHTFSLESNDTITIIKVLLDQLTGAYSGAVSVKEVDAALDDFQTAIKNNDADADEKLRKKFTQG